jgi:hypothetical protein
VRLLIGSTEEDVARRLGISAETVGRIVKYQLQEAKTIDPRRKIVDVGISTSTSLTAAFGSPAVRVCLRETWWSSARGSGGAMPPGLLPPRPRAARGGRQVAGPSALGRGSATADPAPIRRRGDD